MKAADGKNMRKPEPFIQFPAVLAHFGAVSEKKRSRQSDRAFRIDIIQSFGQMIPYSFHYSCNHARFPGYRDPDCICLRDAPERPVIIFRIECAGVLRFLKCRRLGNHKNSRALLGNVFR